MEVNGKSLNNYRAFQQTALRVLVCTHRCRGIKRQKWVEMDTHRVKIGRFYQNPTDFAIIRPKSVISQPFPSKFDGWHGIKRTT